MPQTFNHQLLPASGFEGASSPGTGPSSVSAKQDYSIDGPEVELSICTDSATKNGSAKETPSLPPSSPSTSNTTDISLTPSDISAMNSVLAQARQSGEMPRTTFSPIDFKSVVQDYGLLTRLREARGDPTQPAPEAYTQLRVEVARRILERDLEHDEDESRREAARRVNNYLRSIEQERFFFDAATSSSRSCCSKSPRLPQVDVETFSEELLSIVKHAADQTIVDASEPLRLQLRRMDESLDAHKQRLDESLHGLQTQQEIMRGTIQSLSSLFGPHSAAIQGTTVNLAQLSAIVHYLSQVVTNLPLAMEQIVSHITHHHLSTALRDVMEGQHHAMVLFMEEEKKQRQGVDHDLLAAKIAEKLRETDEQTRRKESLRSRIGRALKVLLKS